MTIREAHGNAIALAAKLAETETQLRVERTARADLEAALTDSKTSNAALNDMHRLERHRANLYWALAWVFGAWLAGVLAAWAIAAAR